MTEEQLRIRLDEINQNFVNAAAVSPNVTLVSFAIDDKGRRYVTLQGTSWTKEPVRHTFRIEIITDVLGMVMIYEELARADRIVGTTHEDKLASYLTISMYGQQVQGILEK